MFFFLPFHWRWGCRSPAAVWLQSHSLCSLLVGGSTSMGSVPSPAGSWVSCSALWVSPGALNCTPEALCSHTVKELLQTAQGCGASPVSSCPAWLCWGSRARVSCGQAVLVLFGVWNSCWTPELAPSPLQRWSRQFLVPLGHPQG